MSIASSADDLPAGSPASGGGQVPGAPPGADVVEAARGGDPPVGAPVSGGGPTSGAPLSGRVVGGKWRVLGLLGRGGMGSVYEAQNTAIGKRVALKFIEGQPDAEATARFQREAEAASSVDSAHIVQVFDTGLTDDGQPYLVMELLRGESLGARLRRLERLSMREAIHVVGQVLRGLHRAHAAGVIHRDLKPDNVFLVDRDDDPLFVKILDFGISKVARSAAGAGAPGLGTITRQGTVLGTPFYMSPEQAQATADLDPRSDLFSVGVILYECLVGHAPWASLPSYEAVIVAVCSRDAPDVRASVPEVPAALAGVVKRGLARDRERRYESASAMLEALRSSSPELLSARDLSSAPSLPPVAPPSSWTPSEPLALAQTEAQPAPHHTPTPTLALAPAPTPRRWPLAVGATLLAFVGTGLAIRQTPPAPPPSAVASTPAPPEVTMRIDTGVPGALVFVGGKLVPDGVLRGPALSSHDVRVVAPGHAPLEQRVLLDGHPVKRLALAPAAPVASSDAAPAGTMPVTTTPIATAVTSVHLRPASPGASASGRPAASSAAPAVSAPGLTLKGHL